ncbi:MAG: hypothetical protein E7Z93_01515 [Cyanobacteria bacterium SIG32]|nr:hypothetical protein [Cyanobacteria bacterium SIG32]
MTTVGKIYGNTFGVNCITLNQQRYAQSNQQGVTSVKERELHPQVGSTAICESHLANKIDLLC